jgi:5,10-methylenetetrahydrofolate reductase
MVILASQLGQDESVPGAPEFCIGTSATVFAPKKDWIPKSLVARVDAGAAFIQTQICFNLTSLRRYMVHLVDARLTWRCAVIVGLAVLPDAASARILRNNLHGSAIPENLVRRIAQATDSEREGIDICVEKVQQLREIPGVSGVNLMTPGPPELLVEVIQAAGLRR